MYKMKVIMALMTCVLSIKALKAQSLESYIDEAVHNNAELQAMQFGYESSLEKVNEAGSLPNTNISAGYFIQEVETRVGPQRTRLSISQPLPWFGTLGARKNVASAMSESELQNIELAERRLKLDVKQAYYDLYEKKASLSILRKNLEILKTYEELALNELESNRTTMVDVLKIRIQINETENKSESVSDEYETSVTTFNLLLNREPNTMVVVVDSMQLDTAQFNKENLINNPQLLRLNAQQDVLLQSEKANQKEGMPSLGVGLDYVIVEEGPMQGPDNGKDVIMPMVSLSIPLFSKKYTSKQKQYQFEKQAVDRRKVEVNNELEIAFKNALTALKNAKRTVSTQKENIYQAQQAEKVILATYETARLDFEQILEVQQLILKFQLEVVEATSMYFKNKAMLDYLTLND